MKATNTFLFLFILSHLPDYQRRPNKVQSGTHPTVKQAVAACLAMTPSAYIDTSVQSQPPRLGEHAMRAASGDPGGGGIPMMR
ncbi:hypothetical protein [Aminipila sp.]|uniref:hypothetical protein n=1 Tax=Aminipila sp. TaxID=2060095 RepID=UPI00289ABE66|nr:hypothetical protein [Aminipila sp.]